MENKVSILILGLSRIVSKRVLPALSNCKFIKDISIASRSKNIELVGKLKNYYDDYDIALSKFNGEFVYISLTNDLHDEFAIKSIKNNFNVIIDKPAILKNNTIEIINELKKVHNVYIFEASVFTYHPIWKSIKTLQKQIDTKTIISIFKIPRPNKNDFRLDPLKKGGAPTDMSVYSLGFYNSLFDEEVSNLRVIDSIKNNGIIDSFNFHIKSKNGTNFFGFYGFGFEYEHSIKFIGSKGSFNIERLFSMPSNFESKIILRENNNFSSINIEESDTFKNFFNLIFNDFILQNKQNLEKWNSKMLQNFYNLQMLNSKL